MAPKKFGMTKRESDARRASASIKRSLPKKSTWTPPKQPTITTRKEGNDVVATSRYGTKFKPQAPGASKSVLQRIDEIGGGAADFVFPQKTAGKIVNREALDAEDYLALASLIPVPGVKAVGKGAQAIGKGAKSLATPRGVAYASTPETLGKSLAEVTQMMAAGAKSSPKTARATGKTAAQVKKEAATAAARRTPGEKATIRAGEAKGRTAETATELEKQAAKENSSKSVNTGPKSTVADLPAAPAGAKMPTGMTKRERNKFLAKQKAMFDIGKKSGRTAAQQAEHAKSLEETIKAQIAAERSGARAGGDLTGEYGNRRVGSNIADSGLEPRTKAPAEKPATPKQEVRETAASARAKIMFEPRRGDYKRKPSPRSSQKVKDAYEADMKRYQADMASWNRNQRMAGRAGKTPKPETFGEENPITAAYGVRGNNLRRLSAKARFTERPAGAKAATPEAPAAAAKPAKAPKPAAPAAAKPVTPPKKPSTKNQKVEDAKPAETPETPTPKPPRARKPKPATPATPAATPKAPAAKRPEKAGARPRRPSAKQMEQARASRAEYDAALKSGDPVRIRSAKARLIKGAAITGGVGATGLSLKLTRDSDVSPNEAKPKPAGQAAMDDARTRRLNARREQFERASAKPKPNKKFGAAGESKFLKGRSAVRQSVIDQINKQGMTKALAAVKSRRNDPEYLEAIRRYYGAKRLKQALEG